MIKTGFLLLAIALGGISLASALMGHGVAEIHLDKLLAAPNAAFWLGNDELGRDVLARAARGVYLSLFVSVCVGAATAAIGIPLGLIAGWRGGWLDGLLVRLADVVLSFPGLLLAMALTALMGPSLTNVIVALGMLGWVGFFRLTRVQVLALRNVPFVQAAVVGGVPLPRVLFGHILPNTVGPLVVEGVVVLAGALVAEAGLSFLGLGVPPPAPSLGGMIREGIRYVLLAPHLVVVPAVMLFCLVVGLNLLAEGLRRRWLNGRTE